MHTTVLYACQFGVAVATEFELEALSDRGCSESAADCRQLIVTTVSPHHTSLIVEISWQFFSRKRTGSSLHANKS